MNNGSTSVSIAYEYILMFFVAGFILWLLNPIVSVFRQYSETGALFDYANFHWYAIIFVILIFSGLWFFRKLKEWKEVRRL